MVLFPLIIVSLFLPVSLSICDTSSAFSESNCPSCCAILYSSENCEIDDHNSNFNVKENGNGILGAIWDDVPKALIVRKGCLLEVWDWKNQTGPKRAFGLEGLEIFPLERYSFESRISSLKCKCVNIPSTTTTTTSIPEYPSDESEDILEKVEEPEEEAEPPLERKPSVTVENVNATIQNVQNHHPQNSTIMEKVGPEIDVP